MTKADERVRNIKVARRISFVTKTDPKVVITCEGEADDQNSPGEPIMIRPVRKLMIRRRVSASISMAAEALLTHSRTAKATDIKTDVNLTLFMKDLLKLE